MAAWAARFMATFPLLKKLAASRMSAGPARKRLQPVQVSRTAVSEGSEAAPWHPGPALRCLTGFRPGRCEARSRPDRSGRAT